MVASDQFVTDNDFLTSNKITFDKIYYERDMDTDLVLLYTTEVYFQVKSRQNYCFGTNKKSHVEDDDDSIDVEERHDGQDYSIVFPDQEVRMTETWKIVEKNMNITGPNDELSV